MKLRYILISALAMASACMSASGSVADYPGIARYVGADSRPDGIAEYTYTPDGTAMVQLTPDGRRVVKCDIKTGKETETLLDLGHTRENTLEAIDGFTISPDGSKIMVYRNKKMVYRRSFTAEYFVYEIRSRLLKPLSTEHKRQQAPAFSPDGRMVAFVADNNIFLKKLDYGTEVAVTTDGKNNEIINGVPDWTYEEEFSTSSSMAWAPDNMTLCYIKYNESQVPMFTFPLYKGD